MEIKIQESKEGGGLSALSIGGLLQVLIRPLQSKRKKNLRRRQRVSDVGEKKGKNAMQK